MDKRRKDLEERKKREESIKREDEARFEKMDKNKKEVITQIQNVFAEIRKELKNREDELLKEVDIIFNNKKFDDKVLENSEKLSENIKSLLNRTENINNGDNGNTLHNSEKNSIFVNNPNAISEIQDNNKKNKTQKKILKEGTVIKKKMIE